MQQNDAGNPADKFFMLDKGKRAVFRQILAGDPLEAQAVHFEASRKQKWIRARKIAKTGSRPKGGPLPKNSPEQLKMI